MRSRFCVGTRSTEAHPGEGNHAQHQRRSATHDAIAAAWTAVGEGQNEASVDRAHAASQRGAGGRGARAEAARGARQSHRTGGRAGEGRGGGGGGPEATRGRTLHGRGSGFGDVCDAQHEINGARKDNGGCKRGEEESGSVHGGSITMTGERCVL